MENLYRNQLREIANMGVNYSSYDSVIPELMKPKQRVYLLEFYKVDKNHIEVGYTYGGKPSDEEPELDSIDKQDFFSWLKEKEHNVITHSFHNHKGIFDERQATYEPEDLIQDPLFDLGYYLELFINETENRRFL